MPRRNDALKHVPFHNPRLATVGVEVMDVATLRARAGDALAVAERVEFTMLLLVQAGSGRHMVDFAQHRLRAGDVVLVRAGQVQQWTLRDKFAAQMVLVSPEALAPSVARAGVDMQLLALDAWPVVNALAPAAFARALADVARLREEVDRFEGSALDAAIIWHGLLGLLLRLARERAQGEGGAAPEGDLYRLFVRELERTGGVRHGVSAFARRLGYSESTLSRACVAATGHSAKHVVDLRTALEAKRLLVHSGATVAEIGHRLGFSEATNFVKFFRRLAGMTPLEFRTAHAPSR